MLEQQPARRIMVIYTSEEMETVRMFGVDQALMPEPVGRELMQYEQTGQLHPVLYELLSQLQHLDSVVGATFSRHPDNSQFLAVISTSDPTRWEWLERWVFYYLSHAINWKDGEAIHIVRRPV